MPLHLLLLNKLSNPSHYVYGTIRQLDTKEYIHREYGGVSWNRPMREEDLCYTV